jgi:hypothetical protein
MFPGVERLKRETMRRTGSFLLAILASMPLSGSLAAQEKPEVRARLIAPERVEAPSKRPLVVELVIGPRWHVNSHLPSESYLIPTNAVLTASKGNLSVVRYPKDVERRFEFSEKPLRVYEGTVRLEATLDLPAGSRGELQVGGELSYQACDERRCFAPAKIPLRATISIVGGEARPAGIEVGRRQ